MGKVSGYSDAAPLLYNDILYLARAGVSMSAQVADLLGYPMAYRNFLDNGSFSVAQRGTSAALGTTAAVISIDRWAAMQAAAANGILAQTTANTITGTGIKYRAKLGRNSTATGVGVVSMAQAIEGVDAQYLAGKRVCFSYFGLAGANFSAASGTLNAYLSYGTGNDEGVASYTTGGWTGQTDLISVGDALSSSVYARYFHSVTIPAAATEVGVKFAYTPVGTAGADDNAYIAGAMLTLGDYPPPYFEEPYEVMLARCLRHLPVFAALNGAGGDTGGFGQAISTTQAILEYQFKVRARKATTGITPINTTSMYCRDSAGNPLALTALAHRIGGQDSHELTATVAAGLVAGNASKWGANNAALAKILFTGAEL